MEHILLFGGRPYDESRFHQPREHPVNVRGNSQRPCVESDRDGVNRCVVFRDVANDGASIDVHLRVANVRP